MWYRYKDAFSLRDKIGTCPNIEVDIDVTDKTPFFIKPYHVREEDKSKLNKDMNGLLYLGTLKEGFSAYFSPVMLISWKVPKDKRVVTDFRHLNRRIANNNLAYPLLQDTFFCVEVVLDVRFYQCWMRKTHSIIYCGILSYFGSVSYLYQRTPIGLNISPSIWQSYINAILDCQQGRKYCKAIMDDLLFFMPTKKSHIAKLEDLLKVLLKYGLKISPKKCQLFRIKSQYMGNTIFIKDRNVCVKPL